MRILVVDDDLVSRIKLETLISAHGQCDTAEDGDEAFEKFEAAHKESKAYDLITMDVDMPGMNGHEAVAKIRSWEASNSAYKQNKEAKILMVTGMQSRTDVIASFREGCEWFVRKPITPENLAESLAKVGVTKPALSRNA